MCVHWRHEGHPGCFTHIWMTVLQRTPELLSADYTPVCAKLHVDRVILFNAASKRHYGKQAAEYGFRVPVCCLREAPTLQ
jgi:hypothetical protein